MFSITLIGSCMLEMQKPCNHANCTLYAPNIPLPNFIKQRLVYIKVKIGPNTIKVGDLCIPLSYVEK
jgi:hypothetical protein